MAKSPTILINEYVVVTADTAQELESNVMEMMSQGWQPMGGVAVALPEKDDFRYVVYAQAMIKIHMQM